MVATDTNNTWLNIIDNLVTNGNNEYIRGRYVKEIIGHQSIIPMDKPIISVKERKLHLPFLFKEAYNILKGNNLVSDIASENKHMAKFSDDGKRFTGHYGPKVIDQIRYIIDVLTEDKYSRQAVINIWRENPRESKDIPCTLSLQFFIRDDLINCISTMRSNDIWLGFVYDVFAFSMIAAYIGAELIEQKYDSFCTLELGNLYHNVGSMHLYCDDIEKLITAGFHEGKTTRYIDYEPILLSSLFGKSATEFGSSLLLNKLYWCSQKKYIHTTPCNWFEELAGWN